MPTEFEQTYGVLFLSGILTTFLFGVTTLQAYLYTLNCGRDHYILKTLVAVVWLLAGLHTSLIIYATYFFTVLSFSHPENLLQISWASNSSIIISNLLILLVQCFLMKRVYSFINGPGPNGTLRAKILLGVMGVLIAGNFALDTAGGIKVFFLTNIQNQGHQVKALTIGSLSFTIAVDVTIAAILCYSLFTSRTGFKRTDAVLQTLILYTINTGLLPSLVAIVGVVTLLAAGQTFWYIFCTFILADMYANTFLATLNSRPYIASKFHSSTTDGISFPTHLRATGSNSSNIADTRPKHHAIPEDGDDGTDTGVRVHRGIRVDMSRLEFRNPADLDSSFASTTESRNNGIPYESSGKGNTTIPM